MGEGGGIRRGRGIFTQGLTDVARILLVRAARFDGIIVCWYPIIPLLIWKRSHFGRHYILLSRTTRCPKKMRLEVRWLVQLSPEDLVNLLMILRCQ